MDKEIKYFVITVVAVVFLICTIISTASFYKYKITTSMAKLGYQETTVIGSNYTVWQKIKGE